ncbi:hypothetical protein QJS10_CPB04g01900 [Acorus calamus]|uniref:chitinase n=1 Tax=Acorus calamus TaxID=4465 RepID=A0AAV9EY77_ACOCL|nr:hypothetical protein QJS10_CPB04g01900 [Acorus calamus]
MKHYCGTTADYCGDGCQSSTCTSTPGGGGEGGNATVAGIVTSEFFNRVINQTGQGCPGKGFYSRRAFLATCRSYPEFGTAGSDTTRKREITAFFAHITHKIGQEIDGASRDYCDRSNTKYPCVPGKAYYGRGPIQISWNYNYGPAGESIGFDGLGASETTGVSQ